MQCRPSLVPMAALAYQSSSLLSCYQNNHPLPSHGQKTSSFFYLSFNALTCSTLPWRPNASCSPRRSTCSPSEESRPFTKTVVLSSPSTGAGPEGGSAGAGAEGWAEEAEEGREAGKDRDVGGSREERDGLAAT